jgi:hypothetical protein
VNYRYKYCDCCVPEYKTVTLFLKFLCYLQAIKEWMEMEISSILIIYQCSLSL